MTDENAESPRTEGPRSYVEENAELARGFTNAPVAGALFAANLGVFLAQIWLTRDPTYLWRSFPDQLMRHLGANSSLWTVGDSRIETLVTSCFLHGSIIHLAMNMFLLWQIGPLLERAIGSARFFPLYLLTGVAASATSAIWGRFFGQTTSFGASGALCGVVAATLVVAVRTDGWKSELTVHMARWLGIIIVIGLIRRLVPATSQIDNAAHFGGAISGAVIAIAWERGYAYSQSVSRAIIAGCVALVVASSLVVYVRNQNDPYAFLDVSARVDAAKRARYRGDCAQARELIQRALQLDPSNHQLWADAERIDIDCEDPAQGRARPSSPIDRGSH
ncbi:MAG: rhomboid family intramembrane serine protease [Deltaproteobacteria bacterium]|nr:rhomboid family intramembrane serine protease [Deltaproteobacteria bacterium]